MNQKQIEHFLRSRGITTFQAAIFVITKPNGNGIAFGICDQNGTAVYTVQQDIFANRLLQQLGLIPRRGAKRRVNRLRKKLAAIEQAASGA